MEYTGTVIFNQELEKVLLQLPDHGRWLGKWSLIGGENKNALQTIQEETAIQKRDFAIFRPLMTLSYPGDCKLNINYGVLRNNVQFTQKNKQEMWWWETQRLLDSEGSEYLAGYGLIPYLTRASLKDMKHRKIEIIKKIVCKIHLAEKYRNLCELFCGK